MTTKWWPFLADAAVQAKILHKAFRGNEFLYTLQLKTDETVMAHVPSHQDHRLEERIGIRPEVDHVVTFASESIDCTMGITSRT